MEEEYIVFACRKCGKHIRRSKKKIGTLVACARCDCTNRTPGVAGQVTLPPGLLGWMKRDYAKHRLVLFIIAIWVISIPAAAYVSGHLNCSANWAWALGVFGALPLLVALLFTTARIFPYLGRSEHEAITLLRHCFPLLFILAITSYFTLRRELRRHEAALTAQDVELSDKQNDT